MRAVKPRGANKRLVLAWKTRIYLNALLLAQGPEQIVFKEHERLHGILRIRNGTCGPRTTWVCHLWDTCNLGDYLCGTHDLGTALVGTYDLGMSGVEEPPGMTASRLSQPPMTPPQCRSMRSRSGIDISCAQRDRYFLQRENVDGVGGREGGVSVYGSKWVGGEQRVHEPKALEARANKVQGRGEFAGQTPKRVHGSRGAGLTRVFWKASGTFHNFLKLFVRPQSPLTCTETPCPMTFTWTRRMAPPERDA